MSLFRGGPSSAGSPGDPGDPDERDGPLRLSVQETAARTGHDGQVGAVAHRPRSPECCCDCSLPRRPVMLSAGPIGERRRELREGGIVYLPRNTPARLPHHLGRGWLADDRHNLPGTPQSGGPTMYCP